VTNPELFRTRSSFFYAGSIYIAAGMVSLLTLLDATIINSITTLAWASFASYAAHLIFVRPKIIFYDEGLMITNPFNELLVGWQEVQDIDNRFSLSVLVDGERFHAWAAPAPTSYGARSIHPSDLKGLSFENQGSIRAADNPRSLSGAAAYLARGRFQKFQESRPAELISKTVTFNTASVVILLGLLALALGWMAIQS
jgi:hypothetical protein